MATDPQIPAPAHGRFAGEPGDAARRVAKEYAAAWDVDCYLVDPAGRPEGVCAACASEGADPCRDARARAVAEGLRWGEPSIAFCPERRLIWAAPLMHNAALVGGLVAEASEQRIFPGDSGRPRLDAVAACTALREAAEAANLTNAALLALNREAYRRERQRAEAIHEYKKRGGSALRELYLQEEPHLLAAIRKGHRPEARGVLNRILVAIHYHAGENIGLAKSLFLELVVSMCRAAVEAGGEAESLLGGNYARMADLAQMQTEDELATWLGEMLERIMDAIQYHSSRQGNTQVQAALEYMRANFTRPITRDDVAREANLSPTHFSRLFRRHTGRRFSDVLNQLRINRACELLARTDRDLVVVALECGFNEQSYFQKVFRRYTGMTPGTYRKQHAVAS